MVRRSKKEKKKNTKSGDVTHDEVNKHLLTLKREKTKVKAAFTREKNKLLNTLDCETSSRKRVREELVNLSVLQEDVVLNLTKISEVYEQLGDSDGQDKTMEEIDLIVETFEKTQEDVNKYLEERMDEASSASKSKRSTQNSLSQQDQISAQREAREIEEDLNRCESEYNTLISMYQKEIQQKRTALNTAKEKVAETQRSMEKEIDRELGIEIEDQETSRERVAKYIESIHSDKHSTTEREVSKDIISCNATSKQIENDLWKQLKRVSIPTFSGDKRNYEAWKAAFMACVDKAPTSSEYKLLQLRQYLSGEALKVIESLGHSATAYEAAKERLERKYGGVRRQIAMYQEDLEKFPPIRNGNARDMEKFADLLDIAVINLKEAGRHHELKNGTLYTKLQQKIPEEKLTQYHRWIYEHKEQESVETLRKWIIQEAEFETVAAETIRGFKERVRHKENKTFFGNNRPEKQCVICEKPHQIWHCKEFKSMSIYQRWRIAKQHKLCYRCLSTGHTGQFCQRIQQCGIDGCTEWHNRMLHGRDPEKNNESTNVRKDTQSTSTTEKEPDVRHGNQYQELPNERTHTTLNKNENEDEEDTENGGNFIALRTVPVVVCNGNRRMVINALLDDASTKTYINSDVAENLGLRFGSSKKVTVNVLNDQVETFETKPVEFHLESLNGKIRQKVEANTTGRVTGNMRPINWKKYKMKWRHLKDIRFPSVGKRPIIDMLIGMDYAELHLSIKDVSGKHGEPIARLTPLGWTCIGSVNGEYHCTQFNRTYFLKEETENDLRADKILRSFWEIENTGIKDCHKMSKDDERALEIVKKSRQWSSNDGRYQVGIPWKDNKDELEVNFTMANGRMKCTEKKLSKDKELEKIYNETFEQYLQKGYIKKIENIQDNPSKWYLPHFPVVRKDKSTTKVRIVFDASAKFNGVALNDVIYQGPKLQKDLCSVLTKFRRNPIAIVCDVAEMYLRIGLAEEDRPYHRFLWRNMDQTKQPDVYEFNSLVFGVNSSPFEAQFVSQENAMDHQREFPLAAETVLESTYMDDSMDSVKDEELGIELYNQLSTLWKKANMHARKWLSNSSKVLERIPPEDCAEQVDLSKGEIPSVKTLGLVWKAKEDVFTYKSITIDEEFQFTKRNLLRKIATLFDPLGFLAPYIIRAKLLMQDVWLSGIEWDDELVDDNKRDAQRWFDELKELSRIEVPRCLTMPAEEEFTLHVFTDASEKAYGAVVYARCLTSSGKSKTNLIISKSRVSPLKSTSIPRLELCGALLGVQLAQSVVTAIKLNMDKVTFWIDSMNVMYWIRNQSRLFKSFVANRLGEIHRVTQPNQWRYVPTKLNPADKITKGMTVEELSSSMLWWTGPEYLTKHEDEWPKERGLTKPKNEDVNKEDKSIKKNVSLYVKDDEIEAQEWRLDPKRFSSWRRLVRVLAWVYRFVCNTRVPLEYRNKEELNSDEIENAEMKFIKSAQMDAFGDEYKALELKREISSKSKLLCLKPILDEDGIMRADTRLKHAEFLSHDAKYPIILPRKNWTTKLIVKFYHEKGNHSAGTNHVLSLLTSKFWIPQGREEIREWENQCNKCKRMKSKQAHQLMAPLPKIRLKEPLHAFARTAVDYGGPFITIQGKGRRREKRYLCLFTCLTTRAVHLEVAFNLDTDKFLNAFYRMVNRRGLPTEIISDNGTNFVGANRELQELVTALDKQKIQKSMSDKEVKWHFNPPAAPHFGGVHETMIKAAKRAINAILGNADVTDEELITAFSGAESLLNSRPLTYQSADANDDVPLTPNHFLHGQVGGIFAPQTVDEEDFHPRKRWRRVQELVNHFWRRWIREWLPSIASRKKWNKQQKNFKINDIVLILDCNSPRGTWPLGRIIETFPGDDGNVRVVKLQVGKSIMTRPITKLCRLEFD